MAGQCWTAWVDLSEVRRLGIVREPGEVPGAAARSRVEGRLPISRWQTSCTWDCISGLDDLTEIGRGGCGVVYRAHDHAVGGDVAVKILPAGGCEETLNAFQREVKALGQIWHPNVVRLHRAGVTEDGQPYMVMEHIEGGSFAQRLAARGALPWAEVVDAGVKLACALDAVHRSGVLHRDIKPENILAGEAGEPKLADFGIAHSAGCGHTRTGLAHTTVAHVPPESLNGVRASQTGDIYSLASTLCTLILGRAPFVEDPADPVAAVLQRIACADPPDLTVAAGVPSPVSNVLRGALAKKPGDRPASALDFARNLRLAQVAAGTQPTALVVPDTSAALYSTRLLPLDLAATTVLITAGPQKGRRLRSPLALSTAAAMTVSTALREWAEARA